MFRVLNRELFCYLSISLLKEFRGSISGDVPRHRFNNGLMIRRNHNIRRFEIHAIEHVVFSAIIPNYSCQIGDNIIELNGLNVANMTLPEVNGILSREVLNSISTTAIQGEYIYHNPNQIFNHKYRY